jgi:hypothetical protein
VVGENLAGETNLTKEFALLEFVVFGLSHTIRFTLDEADATRCAARLASAAVSYIDAASLDGFYETLTCGNFKGSHPLNR